MITALTFQTRERFDAALLELTDFGGHIEVWPDKKIIYLHDTYASFVHKFLTSRSINCDGIDMQEFEPKEPNPAKTKMTADEIVAHIEKKLHAKYPFSFIERKQIEINLLTELVAEIVTDEELEKEQEIYENEMTRR